MIDRIEEYYYKYVALLGLITLIRVVKVLVSEIADAVLSFTIYNPDKKEEIIEKIWASKSKVLFSTLGMKKQEESVIEIMEKCRNL